MPKNKQAQHLEKGDVVILNGNTHLHVTGDVTTVEGGVHVPNDRGHNLVSTPTQTVSVLGDE